MADLWFDVDAALAEVPVNLLPLIDDTDFKTREESVVFNQAGLDLVWNFVTTAGAMTQTAVTPTDTAGVYDWVNQGNGLYSIEIPASGGGTINNDTEGFGWFTGFATGVLPWRGPVCGFRAAGINNVLIDTAYSATRGLAGTALPDAAADAAGGLPISDAGGFDIDLRAPSAAAVVNLEDMYDGTGYTDDTGPASRSQVDGIGAASGGALNFANSADNVDSPLKSISFDGVETSGTNASVNTEDGTYHVIDDAANNIDIVYQFSVGGGRTAAEVTWKGYLSGANDVATIQAYNGSGWDTLLTINGKAGSTNDTEVIPLLSAHTGTGADLGDVFIRIECAAQSNPTLNTDLLLIGAVNIGQTVGYALGRVWVDTVNGTAGTENYVNGTADNPSLTLANAITIAASVGLSDFNIASPSTITLAADLNNVNLYGVGYTLDFAGFDAAGTHFYHSSPTNGIVTSANNADHVDILDSIIEDMTVDDSHFTNCSFKGTVTLGSVASNVRIIGCRSIIAGASTPIFDFGTGNVNHNMTVADWQNGFEIRNFNVAGGGTDLFSLSGTGQLIIAASCDGGTINLRGQWKVTDNSGGAVTITRDDVATDIAAILVDTGTDGVVIAPSQGPVTFTGDTDEAGLTLVGAGTGPGLSATGGATGHGVEAVGGATSGDGVNAAANGAGNGMDLIGVGANAGLRTEGGATGPGIHAHGGATGATPGVEFHAHSTTGDAFELEADGSGSTNVNANVKEINDSAGAAAQLAQNLDDCFTGTASGTPTTTTMVSDIGVTADDQFKGRIITFDDDTSTAALRGQSTDITACTAASNTLTFTALTTAPSSGDTFVIT